MQIQSYFKHMSRSPALEEHVESKIGACIETYVNNPIEAQVTLAVEAGRNHASCHVLGAGGFSAQAAVEDDANMYACIDRLEQRLAAQLRRHKERLTSHKLPRRAPVLATVGEEAIDAEEILKFEAARESGALL